LNNSNVEEAFKKLIYQIYTETIKNNLKVSKEILYNKDKLHINSLNNESNENSGVYDLTSNKLFNSNNFYPNTGLERKNKSKNCEC
jgi:hypothetical protein